MYSQILKCNYEIVGDVAVFEDGVTYDKHEMDNLNKIKSQIELLRLVHSAKKLLRGKVVDAR